MYDATVETIDTLIDRSDRYDEGKKDYRLATSDSFFDEGFHLIVDSRPLLYDDNEETRRAVNWRNRDDEGGEKRVLRLTDNALSQMYQKLGKVHYGRGSNKALPSEYLSRFPNSERAQVLNWTMAKGGNNRWLVRAFEDTCRAVLDSSYPRVWNTELLRQVRRVLLDKGGLEQVEVIRPYLDPDQLHLKFWFPDTGTNVLKVGAVIRNGETGNSRLEAMPMVHRTSCTNSIVIGTDAYGNRNGMSITHYPGASTSALMSQFYANLPAVMNASADLINRLIEAEEVAMPNFREIIDGLAIEHGWDYRFKNAVDEGSEGQRTLGGLVAGVTYAAHAVRDLAPAQVLDVEIIGGNLLYAPQREFARLIRQANEGKRVRA